MNWDGNERRNVNWTDVVMHMAATNNELKNIHESLQDLTVKVTTQNHRIDKLENWRSWILGGMAVMAFLITVFWRLNR